MNKLLRLVLLLELLAAPAAAQTVRADRVTLNAGPCVITSGSAAPNGSRIGNVCDTFIQTTSGAIWTKTSGTGTSSGWIATLAGTGTPGTLPVWTSPGAIGDSIIAQAGGVATITGSATITGTGTMNAATITTNASVGGTATISTAAITGNATIGGTAGITGAATLGSVLDVSGVTTLRSDTSISGNTVLGGWIGSLGYASQVSGWRITPAGAADVRYLFTDELRAKLFTADQETVLAGSERITKSYSTVAQPFTCPAASSTSPLWVNDASTYGDAPVFQTNDFVVIHVLTRAAFGPFTIADCVGQVSAYADGTGANAGQQQWTFTRGAGSNGGAMTGATVVPVNQLVQDLGVSGNGYVEMSAVDGANGVNAPYIQTNTWTTAPVAGTTTTQCRLGNLNGITGGATEYGLVCGPPFVTTQPSVRLSNVGFQLRNVPLDIWNAGVQVLKIDPTVPSVALGNPLPASFGGGNPGIWMGRDSGDGFYKLRIGDPAGNRLTWNGSVLSILGDGSGMTNINGGNIQAGTIQASAINITPIGAALNSDPNAASTSAWSETLNPGYQAQSTRVTDGVAGYSSMRSVTGHSSEITEVKIDPVDGGHKQYRLHAWVRAGGGSTGNFVFGTINYNAGGGRLANAYAGTANGPLPTTWTEFVGTLAMPATTATVQVFLDLNYDASLVRPGWMEAQDIRLEEVLPSTLIKDGAITTAKIQAGAITANEIAANTITVANLNASGFGDNLIKNSNFEGAAPSGLAGWSRDPVTAIGALQQTCCGDRGPGTLLLSTTGTDYLLADYQAVPVQPGQKYRVAVDTYAPATASGFYLRLLESANTGAPVYVRFGTAGPGEVAATTSTDICANCTITGGSWHRVEGVYTVPAGVNWVSLSLWNYSCPLGSCQAFYFDAVEMAPQIGAGHILANSITAGQIAAGTITATQIASGTITATQIAAGSITGALIAGRTITASNLVANTITSNEIGVRAIVAGNINTGTITANEIAGGTITGDRIAGGTIVGGNIAGNTISAFNIQAGTITADKLNVTSLSAISANLGTVNAGTITGVTINGTTINGSTFTGGSININSGAFQVDSSGNVTSTGSANFNGTMNVHSLNAGYNAGGVSTVNFNGDVYVAAGMGLTVNVLSGSGNRLVCTNTNGRLYVAAANGSC